MKSYILHVTFSIFQIFEKKLKLNSSFGITLRLMTVIIKLIKADVSN